MFGYVWVSFWRSCVYVCVCICIFGNTERLYSCRMETNTCVRMHSRMHVCMPIYYTCVHFFRVQTANGNGHQYTHANRHTYINSRVAAQQTQSWDR
jgi:hypothetical protein